MTSTCLKHRSPPSRFLPALLAPLLLVPLAASADCYSMLAPMFTAAKQVKPPQFYATVTKFYSSGSQADSSDRVTYTNGPVGESLQYWPAGKFSILTDTMGSTLISRLNTTATAQDDMFAPGPYFLVFAVNAFGGVKVQELLNTIPIGGLPPRYLTATCGSGLMTLVESNGATSGVAWTIGFTSLPYQYNPP